MTELMDATLPEGTLIEERYRITRFLGRGGFAMVYEAEHLKLGRRAALKVLDLHGNTQEVQAFRARFEREARLAASLDHAHVVKIFDYGFVTQTQQPYIAMELLRGHDLEHALETGGPMSPSRAARLFDGALDALAHGHARGIVHKDLKPANLFLVDPNTAQERLVVLDYGIARAQDPGEARLTQTNHYTGTPAYAAPEYIERQQVSPAIDVYQMGLILGEMLTGKPVVEASTPMGYLLAHCSGQQRLDEGLKHTPLGEVIWRAVQVEPQDRFPDAAALRDALRALNPATLTTAQHARAGAGASALAPHQVVTDAPFTLPSEVSGPKPRSGAKRGAMAALVLIPLGLMCVVGSMGAIYWALAPRDASQATPGVSAIATQEEPSMLNLNTIVAQAQASASNASAGQGLREMTVCMSTILGPIDHSVTIYRKFQRKFGPDKLDQVASVAPMSMSTSFEVAHQQCNEAAPKLKSTSRDAVLAWQEALRPMGALFDDYERYYKVEQGYTTAPAKAAELDARLNKLLPSHQLARDNILRAYGEELVAYWKPRTDHATAQERELAASFIASEVAVTRTLKAPLSAEAIAAREAMLQALGRLADAVKLAPPPPMAHMGMRPLLDNLRNVHKELREYEQKAKALEGRERERAQGTQKRHPIHDSERMDEELMLARGGIYLQWFLSVSHSLNPR